MKTLIFLLFLSCSVPPQIECYNNLVRPNNLLIQINEYRNSIGLPELKQDKYASNIALDHTQWMIDNDTISHHGFRDRAKLLEKYCSENTGEILAKGYAEDEVLQKWLESEGHKSTIEGNYNKTGIGIRDKYYTVIFYRKK